MTIAYDILVGIYSLMLGMSVRMKLVRNPNAVEVIAGIHRVPLGYFPALAAAQFAGAIGLLAGIGVRALGVAAAAGLVLYFIAAISSHIRVRDFQPDHFIPAVVMLALASAALALGLSA